MGRLPRRYLAWLAAPLLLEVACATPKPPEQPPVVHPVIVETTREPPPPPPERELYTAQEALDDVLSGQLEYIGTGRWPGVERSRACAFRNRRVVIVNDYCTLKETEAFRIEVYSPERGRVRIYAETHGALSAHRRRDYFTFMVESAPVPTSDARIPPLTLATSYDQLRSYEQQRYEAYLPSCYGGEQHQQNVGGCLGSLAPRASQWTAQNHTFVERASDEWYRVVRQMRDLAQHYGAAQDD